MRSATISSALKNSKRFKSSRARKCLPMSRFRTSQARDTPVAALVTKSERQPPNIMVVPSISMHPLPTLARRPTGKAVLALEVRSRTLHGHAPWTLSGALTANLHVLTCDKLCPERPCGCRALVYECVHGLLHAWLKQDSSLNLPELPQRYIAAPDGLGESIHS